MVTQRDVAHPKRAKFVRMALVLAGLLPFIAWALHDVAPGAYRVLDGWFRFQCHARADRTLALAARLFPVCSRCLGIYFGLAAAAVIARPRLTPGARRVWLLAAAALMVAEVFVQDATGHAPFHHLRLATGVFLAWPVVLIVLDAAEGSK